MPPPIPQYPPIEPFPHATPDPQLEPYTKRFSDLAAYFEAEGAKLSGVVASLASAAAEAERPAPLGPAPRTLPLSYVFAEIMGGYWVTMRWMLFPPIGMACAMAGGGLAMVHPSLAALPLIAIAIFAAIRASRRLELLRVGEVGDVVARDVGIGRTRYKGWPVVFTRGWRTEVRAYSGQSRLTRLSYRTSRGVFGEVTIGGPEYHGVVVVHPELPGRAYAISDFGSVPRPGANGLWDGSLPLRVWFGSVVSVVLVLAWLSAVVVACLGAILR
jgi:hypothetical protein